MKVHILTDEELKTLLNERKYIDCPDPIELGDEITIGGVVYIKKKVEKKERTEGSYKVKFHCCWGVAFWSSEYWYMYGYTSTFNDEDFDEIDEEQITFKS